jgi:RNA polymerase sigma-70 factor (ECF subfamily)
MNALEFNYHLTKMEKPLLGFAQSLTRNTEDAKDLLQETFVKAIRYKNSFSTGTNFKAWTFTIMKSIFINQYRRKIRSKTFHDDSEGQIQIVSHTVSSDRNAEMDANLKDIYKAINNLSQDLKQPFLKHYSGFKYKEIADDLKLPIGTVKSRIFLARKQLMHELKYFNE